MTTMIATALLAVPAANAGERPTSSVGPVATESPLRAEKAKRKRPAACVARLRTRVVERRAATWTHEDTLDRKRTRTARRARTATSCAYLRYLAHLWAERADSTWKVIASLSKPEGAIRFVFGKYADQALAVARCESGHAMTPRAHNGQYLGMFQMGSYARRAYGHGPDPLTQARSAYAYFVASGKDWSPWQCRPWGLGW